MKRLRHEESRARERKFRNKMHSIRKNKIRETTKFAICCLNRRKTQIYSCLTSARRGPVVSASVSHAVAATSKPTSGTWCSPYSESSVLMTPEMIAP